MLRKFGVLALVCSLASAVGGCSQRLPLEEAGASATSPDFDSLAAPLDLKSFEVVSSGSGHRGVFLRLTRFPEAIAHSDHSGPARIVIDIQGPTGVESPEESYPGGDSVVSTVRVSRQPGTLRVVLDLVGDDAPAYTVHRMADYIMVRIRPS